MSLWSKKIRTATTGLLALTTFTGTVALSTSAGASPDRGDVVTHEFDWPTGLAFGGGKLWVTNAASSSVSEIDPTSGAWLGSLTSPRFGFNRPIAIVGYRGELFVANSNDTVTEVRASNGTLVRRIGGRAYHFSSPVAITTIGNDVLVLNSGASGSVTVFSAGTGALIRSISGSAYALDQPAAFTTSGNDVWVADEGNNSVTELDVSTGQLVRVISAQGLSSPDGIAAGSGMVWVANNASSSVTQISGSTGAVLATKTDQDGSYGFWNPTAMISTGYSIYTMTPYGTSPMVTKMSASTGHPYWFMCNTNGPYYFSELSAFAISNGDLWVASRSGANSKTPGAATGSLTELSLGSGQLIKTLPSH
jgi:DNA-binding beta-propeller fold protein YncE